jgi:hypothetical protein
VTPENVGMMFDSLLGLAKGQGMPHVSWIGTRGVEP